MGVAAYVQLPTSTANLGIKKRTNQRLVGADTVQSDYVIIEDQRELTGVYKASSGVLSVPAAVQNGTTTGFIWVYNPVGSTIKMQLSSIKMRSQFTALAVDLLPGELRASRFTFTGVNSGTQITPAKIINAVANQGQVSSTWATAVATLVSTLDANFYQTMDLVTGGAGHWNQQWDDFDPSDAHEEIILSAGEGVVLWHATAVTTANRRLLVSASWDEFTP